MSWEVIIPFLRPIEPFLRDPDVSDILVNGPARVFIEKDGQMLEAPGVEIPEKSLQVAVRNIARALGDEICEEQPLLDSRLPDGSRVAAVLPPCSVAGTILAIRKFHGRRYTAEELVRTGSLSPELLGHLRQAVESRQNTLISGPTGSGKTTLLSALAAFFSPEDRIVVIEDTSELQLEAKNLVRLEARRGQPGLPAVSIRDLLRTTLRLRPDRILLGEVRGGEAFDLLQALNTGHAGTLATLHADSAPRAIARFTTCVLMSGIDLPYRAIRANIGEAVNVLVHIDRRNGKRIVSEAYSIRGYDPALDRYELKDLCHEMRKVRRPTSQRTTSGRISHPQTA
jgi:pilus assembly protein CpaF